MRSTPVLVPVNNGNRICLHLKRASGERVGQKPSRSVTGVTGFPWLTRRAQLHDGSYVSLLSQDVNWWFAMSSQPPEKSDIFAVKISVPNADYDVASGD